MASLTVIVEGVEQKVPLEAAAVTLGRGLESDVRLKDIKASRRHCQVVKTPKGYQCVDLSSGNGTYVNGIQIKQQMLSPGDKITIGSTTIVFEDAPKAAVSSKSATAKLPVARVEDAPAPAKKGTAKVATARVPVAPTKRTTERVEAARPASQGALKPATQPLSKSGSRVGKPTGRASTSRPPRGTSAAASEAPASKKGPVLVAAAAAVLLLLGGGGWFLFGSRDHGDQVKDQIEQLVKKGDAAAAKDRTREAIAEYRKALELCQGDRHKMRASDITKLIAQMESRLAPPKPEPRGAAEK